MLPNKLTLQGLTVAAAIFATTLSAAARAPSAQSFAGRWSVLVFTDYGTCGGGYRYGVPNFERTRLLRGQFGCRRLWSCQSARPGSPR
jgi:hypothetical protein